MYAIIASGGKQYCAEIGKILKLEKIEAEANSDVNLDKVLMISRDGNVEIGNPTISNAKVVCEVVDQIKADKVRIIKFRRRKHFMKKQGHRQQYTLLKVKDIVEL